MSCVQEEIDREILTAMFENRSVCGSDPAEKGSFGDPNKWQKMADRGFKLRIKAGEVPYSWVNNLRK
jgi:hypothetical protein